MARTHPPDEDEPSPSSIYEPVPLDLAALADSNHPEFSTEWDKFFNGYHERLMTFFEHLVPDADDRDELVQKIFIRGYRAIAISGHPLKSAGAAWNWLTTIGKNLLRDGYDHADATDRAMETHKRFSTIEDELRQHTEDMLERLASADGYEAGEWPVSPEAFAERLAQLTDDERLLLQLRFIEDLKWQDIGERLQIKVDAARQRFTRITKFLRHG